MSSRREEFESANSPKQREKVRKRRWEDTHQKRYVAGDVYGGIEKMECLNIFY